MQMRHRSTAIALAVLFVGAGRAAAAGSRLIGWNNLGMHCMDPDYGVFALLPPYNTLEAQLVDAQGRLLRDPTGLSVTYEAVADPDGSFNSTAREKTNFWDFVEALFGVSVPADVGLAGAAMPGTANMPQPMAFDSGRDLFTAEGIPITPTDDAGDRNSYPLMRLVARDSTGRVLAATEVVLPVSDELNCHACHASDSSPAAQPLEGWVHDADPERDTRLNILSLHDDRESFRASYQEALVTTGYAPGLFASANGGRPVLCARCHPSNALPGSGVPGISPLTQAVHRRMANVLDPLTGMRLDDVANRSACYRCHPGAVTRCLRGAMGSAVAADGTRAMQCQSCHGSMADVGNPERAGWLDEPRCESCHTGSALRNSGQLRYTTVFEPDGTVRRAADDTFATNPDTPAPGLSLYRFSRGHGGLACEACHGATHAEYPSAQRNDNLQSLQLQGHVGMLVECVTCHAAVPDTIDGGPHGLHPVGAAWVERHGDAAEEGGAQRCRACHGDDFRGTVLSRAQGDRVFDTDFGRKHFWRGFQIGCYTCHRGPSGEQSNPNHAPVVEDAHAAARAETAADIHLVARDADADPLTLRIVAQAQHGTVGLEGMTARYLGEPGFSGTDAFTFTASDGSTDGNLATVVVTVDDMPCAGDCDHGGSVGIDELVRGVSIALGEASVEQCAVLDVDGSRTVTIDELIRAIGAALNGCLPAMAAR
jgi:hypothetical protein